MIAVVVMFVAISLILFYSDDIKKFLLGLTHPNDDSSAIKVESPSFPTSQVRTYIISCWDKYKMTSYKDKICYVLLGSVSNVDTSVLSNSLDSPSMVDMSKFDKSKTTTIIKKIINGTAVESS